MPAESPDLIDQIGGVIVLAVAYTPYWQVAVAGVVLIGLAITGVVP